MTDLAPTQEEMLAMNEALIRGSVRQHELTEAASALNVQLQEEIAERKRFEAALRENEKRYRDLFNAIDEGFCVIEKVESDVGAPPDFRYLEANPAFAMQSGMSGMIGKTIRQMVPDEPEGWCSIYDTVLRTGEPVRFERDFVTYGRALELYALRVEDETHRRVAVIFKDVTERKQADAALRESEERFRMLFAAAPMAVFVCDRNAVIQQYNERAVEFWGREPERGVERHCGSTRLWLPDGTLLPHAQSPIMDVLRTGIPARSVEVSIERPDGSLLPVLVNFAALKNARGEITGAITSFMDITERKKAEDYQSLLHGELAHRGRNLLAVFQAIVARSLSGTQSLGEAREGLMRRLQALARSQSALEAQGHSGATVAEIVRLELEGFSDRIAASGPDVLLDPRRAQTFTLLVHELATNASKYGALSATAGDVAIRWSAGEPGGAARFKFQWQERNGPRVVPPTRKGFGRSLLENVVAQDFGTTPKIGFAPEGLTYEIDAPLSRLAANGGAHPR